MTGYVRVDTGNNIADGNVINAADLDNEFDGVQAAFNSSTGHTHDGTSGEGAPITTIGPVQDVVVSISAMYPKTTNTVDLGTGSLKYKDLYIAGTATLPIISSTTIGATTGNITTVNATTVDTTNIEVTNIKAKDGTAAGSIADSTGVVTLASAVLTTADINGGTLDSVTIGGGTAAAATFTTVVGTDATDSTSTTTGAFKTAGGLGVAKALWVGGLVNITGVATLAANPVLSGGTANGVAYLNGSKVLTTGSALVFDGTNLGIGTSSPTQKLTIADGNILLTSSSSTDQFVDIGTSATNSYSYVKGAGKNASATTRGWRVGYSPTTDTLNIVAATSIDATTGLRIDYSGNVGLGVTPSAWGSARQAIQIKYGLTLAGSTGSYTFAELGANYYTNSSTVDTYLTSNPASKYRQLSGEHSWYTAASGTAGNAITFTQAMTLDASGNLGVGATSPATYGRFVVSHTGTLAAAAVIGDTTTVASGTGLYLRSTTEGRFSVGSGAAMTFYNNGSNGVERMRLDASGNLGLGVTPSAWSGFSSVLQQRGGGHVVADTGAFMQVGANNYYNGTNWIYTTTAPASRFVQNNGLFQWYNAASGTAGNAITFTQAMTLDASGNLGVGVTSPSTKLNIKADASYGSAVIMQNSAGTQATRLGPEGAGTNVDTGLYSGGYFRVYVNGNTSTPSAMVDSSGNLLVGTTTAYNSITVKANSGANALAIVGRSSDDIGFLNFHRTNGTLLAAIGANPTALEFDVSGSERMRIDSSGNLLVGSTSMGYTGKIHSLTTGNVDNIVGVVDNSLALPFAAWSKATSGNNLFAYFMTEGSYTVRGSIDYNRAAGLVRYNTTSDATLKNIIGDSDGEKSVEVLNSTRIREYSWKDDETNKPQIGVIAQELYETFKGAVSVGGDVEKVDDEGNVTTQYRPWAVDKTAFTFHLIAGWQKHEKIIQEQQAIITSLTARIEALEA